MKFFVGLPHQCSGEGGMLAYKRFRVRSWLVKVVALGIFVVSEYLPKKCLTKHPDVQFQNPKFQVNILNRSEDMDIQNLTF